MKKTEKMTLQDLFFLKIQALYDIEQELVKALPKMAKAAKDDDLKKGFLDHLEETKEHVKRLEKVFDLIEKKPKKIKAEGIRGLVADAKWLMETIEDPLALDAALIGSASYVEHYEIAGYTSAREWAKELGENEASNLLQQTLLEEEAADKKLSRLAKEKIDMRTVGEKA